MNSSCPVKLKLNFSTINLNLLKSSYFSDLHSNSLDFEFWFLMEGIPCIAVVTDYGRSSRSQNSNKKSLTTCELQGNKSVQTLLVIRLRGGHNVENIWILRNDKAKRWPQTMSRTDKPNDRLHRRMTERRRPLVKRNSIDTWRTNENNAQNYGKNYLRNSN